MNYNFFYRISDKFVVYRDDLYPFLGGGNKGRKMDYIATDIFNKKANAIVTTGGIQSNHCRAVAIFAAMNKMQCSLVLHGKKDDFFHQSGNARIMRLSGAELFFVQNASQIGPKMDESMNFFIKIGKTPYYLRGGGHTMEGGLAYIEAIKEIYEYCTSQRWFPKYIFLASGTGSTQAGILAGLDKYKFPELETIGISIARETEQASNVISQFYIDLCSYYNIDCLNRKVVILDEYICGGYGKFNEEILQISNRSINEYGFTLDTCYTAKAIYGMNDFIHRSDIHNQNVLFWHTGGIFNYLAE